MKRFITILIVGALYGGSTSAQTWIQQRDWATGDNLVDVDFVDAHNGWGVGTHFSEGMLLHTTDGGVTWTHQGGSFESYPMSAVDFVGANLGWVHARDPGYVEPTQVIRRTIDGGATWITQHSASSSTGGALSFVDSSNGWAIEGGQNILHTTNSGIIWTQHSFPFADFRDITAVNYNYVWAAFGQNPGYFVVGNIAHSTNGGVTWTYQADGNNHLNALSFTDVYYGWAAGDNGVIIHTTDGGTSWATQTSGTTLPLWGLDFSDRMNGWATGWGNMILHTTDGGSTWTDESSGSAGDNTAVTCQGSRLAWTVGGGGAILHYCNGAVSSPQGAEVWQVGSSKTIQWTGMCGAGNVNILLNRTYPSGTWETVFANTPDDGEEVWTVAGPTTTMARVRVNRVNEQNIYAESTAEFAIGSISVTSPNGGEVWQIGRTRPITWSSSCVTGNVNILANRTYPGGTWDTLFSNAANDGNENWIVTGWATAQARIRIWSVSHPLVYDESDANFTICQPTVSYPNGGELLAVGGTERITWSSGCMTGNVNVLMNRNYSLGTWETLFSNTSNDGNQNWVVTLPLTTLARIRVQSVSDTTMFEESNANFTICQPWVIVNNPDSGEVWSAGSTRTITWSGCVSGTVRISLNRSFPGGAWETLFSDTPDDGNQNWSVTGPLTTSARIRVTSVDMPSIYDESNANFTIQPGISVSSPNGGDSIWVSQTHSVRWIPYYLTGTVTIGLNRNYPIGSWQVLGTRAATDSSFQWTITEPSTSAARIRVVSNSAATAGDTSDANFVIVTPAWQLQQSGTTWDLKAVDFVDSSRGWAVGAQGEMSAGVVVRTTNGGSTWTTLPLTVLDIRGLDFVDANNGWLVSYSGTKHTSDGGATWVNQSDAFLYNGVRFVDANTGWTVGIAGRIRNTTDGGATWMAQTANYDLHGADFVDVDNGWVVGGIMYETAAILRTTDGGNTWDLQDETPYRIFMAVDFVNTQFGWVVGEYGAILHTTDGGSNWIVQSSGTNQDLRSVAFEDEQNGCVVGHGGTILRTTDGGSTWNPETTGGTTSNLYGVSFVDGSHGWAVGYHGIILHRGPATAGSPPAAPHDVVIMPVGTSVGLYWNRVPGSGIQYKVYSDSTCAGAFTQLLGTTSDTTYVDIVAALRKFYMVRAERP